MKRVVFKILDLAMAGGNQLIKWSIKYPFLIMLIVILFMLAMLVLIFYKDANVGGMLNKIGSLFGDNFTSNLQKANTIPEGREVDIGKADDKGYVQHKVKELERSLNPFRDKTIIVTHSGKKIKLPNGVKDTDIETVMEIDGEITLVPTTDSKDKVDKITKDLETNEKIKNSANDLLKRLKERG